MADRRTLVPLETALRLARAAVSAVDGDVWVPPCASESLEPQFAWICVSLRVPREADGPGHTHARLVTARTLRESLTVLTLLAACKGFGLQENAAFWSDVLPCRLPQGSIPSWARGNWSERCARPRPCSTLRHPRFRFVSASTAANCAAYLLSVLGLSAAMNSLEKQVHSPEFDEALRALCPWVIRERLAPRIECGVEVQGYGIDRTRQVLQACEIDARFAQHADAAPADALALPTVCVEKIFYSSRSCDNQYQALNGLTQLVRLRPPVQLGEAHLRIGEKRQRKPDQVALDALRDLLWNLCQDDRTVSTETTQWRFELGHASMISTLCSAFPSFTNAHRLHLSFDGGDDDTTSSLTWRWLAATLFHPSSASAVQWLTMENCRLTMDDVAAVEAVLQSDWSEVVRRLAGSKRAALSALSSNSAQSLAQRGAKALFVTVKEGTRVESKPVRRLFSRPLVTLWQQRSFRVLDSSPSWICLQLPGYECGYIERTSALAFEERGTDIRQLTTLRIEVDDAAAVVALLRLVGGSLRHLSLQCSAFQREHLVSLLKCCPGLASLRVKSAKLDDFSDLIEAYASDQCAITSLAVNTPTLSKACITRLCSTLADRKAAKRCPLRELRLGTGRMRSDELEEILGMLDANRTLGLLHIRIAFDLFDTFFPRFQAHRGDHIYDRDEIKRTIAFLFAIGYYSGSSSPMKSADAAVIGLILSFAGAGTRAISVEENTDSMSLEQIVARSRHTGAMV